MRIVIASDLHWPTTNGIATFGRNLAHGLAGQGHEVLVIAPSQTGKRGHETDRNHLVVRTTSLPFPFYQNFRISVNPYSEVKKAIERFEPDVIHIQTPLGIGRAAMNVAKKLDIPLVATNHAIPANLIENLKMLAPFARPIGYLLKEYGTRFHNNTDYVTLPTKAAIDMFDDKQKDVLVPIVAVSNGIDLARFKPGPRDKEVIGRFNIPAGKPTVMYAGRLDAEKHLFVVVQAMQRLREHLDAHAIIVGHGNDADNLKRLARELGLSKHITFTGRVTDEDLPKLYRLADVFAMPSPAELQCIVLLEAMATGLPSVAVNAGALYELCQDGRNGYLTQVDDSTDMADKLLAILQDKKLRASMGKEALAIANTHDLATTIATYESIYKEVIAAHSRSGDSTA